MFYDIIGFGTNGSYAGFPGPDSDIYGNYFSHCWDDGIESEGGNRNTRIWGNYIDETYIPIVNAASSIGPLYVWKNTSGRCYSPAGSEHGSYSAFMKMGYAGSIDWMTGQTYIFNNTILQPNGEGAGGIGASRGTSNRKIRHCQTRNNILHSREGNSISVNPKYNLDFDYDYDLCSGGYPSGHESNGIDGTPIYINDASFDYENMTANFFLNSNSPGLDAGTIIPNFTGEYEGSAPDMGAFETGQPPTEYGVNAYITTDVDDKDFANLDIPTRYSLTQNYPNPFNPTTVISYKIPQSGFVTLKVFNVLGEEVATIANQIMEAGYHEFEFNASSVNGELASGIFLARLESKGYSKVIKMLFIK